MFSYSRKRRRRRQAMKNAHERFGELVYLRRTEKTRTHIRVHLSAWIGEDSKAHLVSVVGGDTEIGALAAAFANNDPFTAIDPEGVERIVSLGATPTCFRGPIGVANRRRPLRHLVGLSQEMVGNAKQDRLLLISEEPMFVSASLVLYFGLPALPEWADWFLSELKQEASPGSRWLRISSCGRETPPTGTAQAD